MTTLLWVVTGNRYNDIHTLIHYILIYYRNSGFIKQEKYRGRSWTRVRERSRE